MFTAPEFHFYLLNFINVLSLFQYFTGCLYYYTVYYRLNIAQFITTLFEIHNFFAIGFVLNRLCMFGTSFVVTAEMEEVVQMHTNGNSKQPQDAAVSKECYVQMLQFFLYNQ